MRLNIRLIGLLNGILLLGLIGLRVLGSGAGRGNRDNNAAPIFVIAIAMLALGFIGQFFASLIKAAVGRQREWLADASAVQFTRNPQGLEGALKKIAGLPSGSQLTNARNAKEVSHMLFGEGSRVSRLFASHPPLMDRIAALDPSFKAEQVAKPGMGGAPPTVWPRTPRSDWWAPRHQHQYPSQPRRRPRSQCSLPRSAAGWGRCRSPT
jgi:hypothetical protein